MRRRQFAGHAASSLLGWGGICGLVAGCAQRPMAREAVDSPVLPTLRLAPALLTNEMSLVQRLTVSRLDAPQATPSLVDVQLELDRESLRMAGFALGQRVLLVQWDGISLDVQRHPRLPREVDVDRVLRDMTLLYWPVDAIRAALPDSWTLFDAVAGQRQLQEGSVERVRLTWQGDLARDSHIEIRNLAERYRLVIESRAGVVG